MHKRRRDDITEPHHTQVDELVKMEACTIVPTGEGLPFSRHYS